MRYHFISYFRKKLSLFGMILFLILIYETNAREKNTKLLRVWPSYRAEECDWAIRKFICLRCLKNGYKYAQEISFDEERRPIRLHGCFSDQKGFFPIEEGKNHPIDF
jgi:hypothetical protein